MAVSARSVACGSPWSWRSWLAPTASAPSSKATCSGSVPGESSPLPTAAALRKQPPGKQSRRAGTPAAACGPSRAREAHAPVRVGGADGQRVDDAGVDRARAAGGPQVARGLAVAGCPSARSTARAAVATKRRKRRTVVRSLWGEDSKGRFRTRGKASVATVRGTVWLVEDRCDGTLTRVRKGAVEVRDLRSGRTKLVRAGGTHLVPGR
jgi:hypothetical protein